MNLVRFLLFLSLLVSARGLTLAQDQKAATENANETTQTPSDAEMRQLELAETIRESDPEAAGKVLHEAIAVDPESYELQSLRPLLISRLLNSGKFEAAITEAEAARSFHLARLKDPRSADSLASITSSLRMSYERAGQPEKFTPVLEESVRALRENPDAAGPDAGLVPLGALVSMQAQMLAGTDPAAAEAILAKEIEGLSERLEANKTERPLQSWIGLMQTRISLASRSDQTRASDLAAELEARVRTALEQNPDSVELTSALLRSRLMNISRIMREEPEKAQAILDQTSAMLDQSSVRENPVIARMAGQLPTLAQRIAAARLVLEMIGKPAPTFDVDAWAHGEALPQESLRGKVVLVDFWAIWCGPCVATFPHLKEWHEEFHDQGFEIVGVTRKFGYQWDEETGKVVRAARAEDVSMETELVALDKFMASHELRHPTIVTPQESDMNVRYGVTGIPHAVLIDRQGNVRMVKVGSGDANAAALREMIQTLLSEPVESGVAGAASE